jgi:hypothetical protein
VLPADETQALASRARIVARAVVGLVLDEERAARFVQAYSSDYRRPGIAGEAEHKAEFLAAIERESLLLVAARIVRTLPQVVGSRFSRQAQSEAVAGFREAYLTFLGGSLAWDNSEREAFRRDLSMYLRLADREGRVLGPRRGQAPAAGAFVDRCAFLIDPSLMAQAREAAARYQAELVSCADEAVRAAFRGLGGRPSPSRARVGSSPSRRPRATVRRRPVPRPKTRAKRAKPRPKKKRATAPRRKAKPGRKPASRRKSAPRQTRQARPKAKPRRKSTPSRKPSRRKPASTPKAAPRRKASRPGKRPAPRRPRK